MGSRLKHLVIRMHEENNIVFEDSQLCVLLVLRLCQMGVACCGRRSVELNSVLSVKMKLIYLNRASG